MDEAIRSVLKDGPLAGTDMDVTFESPTRDWTNRQDFPLVNAFLYDIQEDVGQRQYGYATVRDQQDAVVSRRLLPRWFRLSYLVTAWTHRPQEDHRLLSSLLSALISQETLTLSSDPKEAPTGDLALSVCGEWSASRSLTEIWAAIGNDFRPSINMVVTAPVQPQAIYTAGPPVTEGSSVTMRKLP